MNEEEEETTETPVQPPKIRCQMCGKPGGTEDLHACPANTWHGGYGKPVCNCCTECEEECAVGGLKTNQMTENQEIDVGPEGMRCPITFSRLKLLKFRDGVGGNAILSAIKHLDRVLALDMDKAEKELLLYGAVSLLRECILVAWGRYKTYEPGAVLSSYTFAAALLPYLEFQGNSGILGKSTEVFLAGVKK